MYIPTIPAYPLSWHTVNFISKCLCVLVLWHVLIYCTILYYTVSYPFLWETVIGQVHCTLQCTGSKSAAFNFFENHRIIDDRIEKSLKGRRIGFPPVQMKYWFQMWIVIKLLSRLLYVPKKCIAINVHVNLILF